MKKIKDFINFELSPEGQAIIQSKGFFSITENYISHNAQQGLGSN